MDDPGIIWYFPAMMTDQPKIPAWQLYGEDSPFPDLLHIERIKDRAAGLDWRIAPHRHVHLHQVFLVTAGGVDLTLNGEAVRAVPPVVLNIPRGTVHGFAFSAGTEGFVLTLPATDFPELFDAGAEPFALLDRPFAAAPTPEVEAGFQAIAGFQGGLRRLRLRATAVTLACAVADLSGAGGAAGPGDLRIARFDKLIRGGAAQGWRLADYARELGLSERHLRRLCQEATGLSAHEYIDAARLREACCLLAYTRMRVQEVGFALGFEDPAYFARAFRRGTGLSPGAYRARLEQ